MKFKKIEQVSEYLRDKDGNTKLVAAHIVRYNGNLTREIVEEWLNTLLPMWLQFYDQLNTDPASSLEGHVQGPSKTQAAILKRMRDKGHRIGPVRGMFRWIGGHDDMLRRNILLLMVEKGWLRVGWSAVAGLEYILEPTREGMKALANYELDTSGRDRRYGRQE